MSDTDPKKGDPKQTPSLNKSTQSSTVSGSAAGVTSTPAGSQSSSVNTTAASGGSGATTPTGTVGSSTAAGSTGSASGSNKSAGDMAKETGDAAKSRAAELADSAKAQAGSMAEKGKSLAYDKADEFKGQASSEIERTADHVRAAGREFGEDSYAAQAADYLASSLSDAAGAIRSRDMDDVLSELNNFARRNPAVFLGGAALLGFAAARMFKASERGRYGGSRSWDESDPYARDPYDRDPYARRFDAPPAGVAHTPHASPSQPATPTKSTGGTV